jgi:hypothetical protein
LLGWLRRFESARLHNRQAEGSPRCAFQSPGAAASCRAASVPPNTNTDHLERGSGSGSEVERRPGWSAPVNLSDHPRPGCAGVVRTEPSHHEGGPSGYYAAVAVGRLQRPR